jgi:hypothetical protein
MMGNIFLNAVQLISDNRFWLGPVVMVCVYLGALKVLLSLFGDIARERGEL